MPKHIGVILDGNRRWAIEHGYMKWYGHKIGARKLRNLIKWAKEFNIKYLTVFAFSTENFKRGEEEMKWFSNLLREELESALEDDDLSRHSIKIKFIGDISKFPTEIQEKAKLLEERTKNNSSLEVNIALGYGGKWDIINATRKIVKDVLKGRLSINDITYDTFQNYLATSHMTHQDVDLILRTGGEMRLSNFLLWQAAYSELVFLDVYWPEFRKIDFMRAIRTYQQRNRRFGR
jgi:tritrans,polycis-undecaprenyl-diphosphate synthase [geranylgeranyl-diphosphate specific]